MNHGLPKSRVISPVNDNDSENLQKKRYVAPSTLSCVPPEPLPFPHPFTLILCFWATKKASPVASCIRVRQCQKRPCRRRTPNHFRGRRSTSLSEFLLGTLAFSDAKPAGLTYSIVFQTISAYLIPPFTVNKNSIRFEYCQIESVHLQEFSGHGDAPDAKMMQLEQETNEPPARVIVQEVHKGNICVKIVGLHDKYII